VTAPTPADLAAPFLNAPIPPADEALAAVHDLDFEVREIANGKRKPGKLSLEKLAVVLSYVRSAATREPPAPPELSMSMFLTRADYEKAVATQRQPIVPEGFVLMPKVPTADMLAVIRTNEWPEDWQRGKALQREHGHDVVAPECHTEIAAGQYTRLIALATPVASDRDSLVPSPSAQPAEPKERKPLRNLQTWLTCKLIGNAATPAAETIRAWIDALAPITGDGIQEQPKESKG